MVCGHGPANDAMMQVLLDDIPTDIAAQTVGEAIDAAADLADGRGRLIVDVSVDGTHWTQSELASATSLDGAAAVVRLTSAEPAQLVAAVFTDAIDSLGDADDLQREAAELLQSDQHTIALDKLEQAISIWQSVQQAIVQGSHLMELDLNEIAVNDTPISVSIQRLGERLRFVRSALEERDQIGLADNLLYEFPEVVDEWRSILTHLEHLVKEQS